MTDNHSGTIVAIAAIVAISMVIFMIIRRRERTIARLGYFPCEDIPVRVKEFVLAFTGYAPAVFRERSRSSVPMYMMDLETPGDEAPICCVAAKTDSDAGGRIVFLKAYGNKTLLKLADRLGGGMQDGEYAKHGLVPLKDLNETHLKSHGIKAYADHEPDTGSPAFRDLLAPVLEFDKDAAGAGYADGYAIAWCGSPKRAHGLCESMYGAVQRG